MDGFGEDDTLGMGRSRGVEFLGELRFLPQQYGERTLVFLPVVDSSARHAAVDGSLGYGGADFGNKAGGDGLGNEVVAPEV